MSGTHVGIIGNVPASSPAVKAEIKQAMDKISAAGPFLPLVLHYCVGQGGTRLRPIHRQLAD